MAIYRGEENIKALYRGGSPIARAYVGGTLVYQRPTSATMKKTLFQSLVPKATATEISFLFKNGTDLTGYTKLGVVDDDGWIEVWNSGTKYKVVSEVTIQPNTCIQLLLEYQHVTAFDFSNFDTINVTDMDSMFRGCSSLTELDVTHFNTTTVGSMSGMFSGCSSLTELDVTHFNTTTVNNMSNMFYNCSSLTELDVTHFNTTTVNNMVGMFRGCTALTTIISNTFDKSVLTTSKDMFYNCTSLVGGNGTVYDSTKTDATYARVDTAETPGYFTAPTE